MFELILMTSHVVGNKHLLRVCCYYPVSERDSFQIIVILKLM